MKYWLGRVALFASMALLIVVMVNASWIAGAPLGGVKLIAHRGLSQSNDPRHSGDACAGAAIEPPLHDFVEDTSRSMAAAAQLGADMVEVNVVPTADGRIALFPDAKLECRTEGHGDPRTKRLAELQALDTAARYSADGGATFPLRGRPSNHVPSLEQAVAALPATPILFRFTSDTPGDADALAAALKALPEGISPRRDAFTGPPGPIRRIRTLFPTAWAWSPADAAACSSAYARTGWSGIVPAACHNGTLFVPLDRQWVLWGWPNRLLQRMDHVGARVVIVASQDGKGDRGLSLPEQLGQIPSTFAGYVWVDDLWNVAPALRPARDFRSRAQQDAAEAVLAKRRASLD